MGCLLEDGKEVEFFHLFVYKALTNVFTSDIMQIQGKNITYRNNVKIKMKSTYRENEEKI